jgi:cation:H+ antiporter
VGAAVSVALGIVLFAGGAALLVAAVERLAKALTAWAAAAGLSGVALSALVLGADLESTAAGVSGTLNDVPEVALGASVGSAVLLLTLGLGLAGVVAPFRVAPPLRLLAASGIGIALAALLLTDGDLDRLDGALLVAGFAALLAGLVLPALRAPRREAAARGEEGARGGEAAVAARGAEGARGGEGGERREGARGAEGAVAVRAAGAGTPRRPALAALAALAVLVAGAELLVLGTERIVDGLGIAATFFGLVVVAAAVSLEELVLEMLPAYRGAPEISVGNALGTTLFMLTGSLGVVAMVEPFVVPDAVVDFHLPALAVAFALAAALLARGGIGRRSGAVLVAAYPLYVLGAALTA